MPEITIGDTKTTKNHLTSTVKVSDDLRKYLKTSDYFAIYNTEIIKDKSILNIPLLATILPLAWLTGSDIYVDKLDLTFKESADSIQRTFCTMYKAEFTTEIIANEFVENKFKTLNPRENTALLFSGGVDSTYSLISRMHNNPKNIMIWGVDGYPYPVHHVYWEKVISTYRKYFEKRGLEFYTIESNPLEILHERHIEHKFHKVLRDGGLWARLQHSLILLPITAPLSVNRFNKLLIASSTYPSFPYKLFPWGSQPLIDEKIKWSGVDVVHDGYIPKNMKILTKIKDYYNREELKLRVCMKRKNAPTSFNCSNCEKCYRTIIPLLLAGIDPNKCGFTFDSSNIEKLQLFIEEEHFPPLDILLWKPMQDLARKEYSLYSPQVSEFFQWFVDFELKRQYVQNYRRLYYSLPFLLAKILNEVYKKIGINIQDPSPLPADVKLETHYEPIDPSIYTSTYPEK